MAKIEDDVKAIKEAVETLKNEVNQIKFNVLRIHSEIGKIEGGGGGGSEDGSGQVVTAAVDLGPIEERLDEMTKKLITRDEIQRLEARVEELASERIREAQETISRVTALFQSGLEMVKLESTLADVKSLLEETVLQG
jgi:predicted  nucleic acid-binding Zn-ribbon protein